MVVLGSAHFSGYAAPVLGGHIDIGYPHPCIWGGKFLMSDCLFGLSLDELSTWVAIIKSEKREIE